MAEKMLEVISDHLECGICSCRFDNARYLECLHTFCERCINRLLDQTNQRWNAHIVCIRCPICRRVTRFNGGKAETLKPNLIVNRIIDELEHQDQIPSKDSKKDLCHKHGVQMKFFCHMCNEIVCSEGAIREHCRHTFLIKKVEDASKLKVDEITTLVSQATLWLESNEEVASSYEKQRAEGNKKLDDVKQAIEASYLKAIESITNKIKVRRDSLLAEVASSRHNLAKTLDGFLVPLTEAIAHVSNDIKFAEDLLEDGDPKKILLQYQKWAKSIVSLIGHDIPLDARGKSELIKVRSICYQECPTPLLDVPKLGIIRRQMTDTEHHHDSNPLPKTNFQRSWWSLLLSARFELISGRIDLMTPYLKDSILVRYRDGHMEVLYQDGTGDKIETPYIPARDMAALSDGRFVTLSGRNTLTIYNIRGERQGMNYRTREDNEIADAIATDVHDDILLLYPGVASVMKFSADGGRCIDGIPMSGADLKDVLKMTLTKSGKIMVVLPEEVLTFSYDGGLCRRLPIALTDSVSCDRDGNVWMISPKDIQGSLVYFLKVCEESGNRVAETSLPCNSAARGFKPWGVATSNTAFTALISPNETGLFVQEEISRNGAEFASD